MRRHHLAAALFCILGLAPFTGALAQAPAPAAATSAKTWADRRQQIEDYLKTAAFVKMEDIGVGVTHPQRAHFAAGGVVESAVWKALRPGRYDGYWESYTSEIAGYEMDKLLELGMVPPKVERTVAGARGAAIMWVAPVKSFGQLGGAPTQVPPAEIERWTRQIIKAKMFHNLIGDLDPNLGNWLVDPAWNLILVDSSRAFTASKKLTHQFDRVDAPLWDRMKALDLARLTSALEKWIGKGEIRAVLARRDAMQSIIDKLIANRSEADVLIR